jgi:hypothetical protein
VGKSVGEAVAVDSGREVAVTAGREGSAGVNTGVSAGTRVEVGEPIAVLPGDGEGKTAMGAVAGGMVGVAGIVNVGAGVSAVGNGVRVAVGEATFGDAICRALVCTGMPCVAAKSAGLVDCGRAAEKVASPGRDRLTTRPISNITSASNPTPPHSKARLLMALFAG